MKLRLRTGVVAVQVALLAACAHSERAGTLATLHRVPPDTTDVRVDDGLQKAVQGYRQFLQETPASELTPEAMRRLADLQLEKEYGVRGTTEIRVDRADDRVAARAPSGPAATASAASAANAPAAAGAKPVQMAAPEVGRIAAARSSGKTPTGAAPTDIERQVEQRATQGQAIATASTAGVAAAESGPLESIKLYDKLLTEFPNYAYRDQVLYQKARAYDELGQPDDAMAVMEQLVKESPDSKLADEVQFRRGESFFVHRKYRDAEGAYQSVVAKGAASEFYEPSLFKLGWSFYKQGAFEEALHRYFALIDHKVAKGYVLGEKHTATEDRRVEDTFNVIALSFSNLGGPEVIGEYFAEFGHRKYEDHAYRYLGEFYLSKQRYQDAATVYQDFVKLYPFHATSPDFSLRTIGIYETGGFPQLVVDAKRDFAARYGLKAEYWQHQPIGERPEVVAALKSNLMDLANHYHARYQDPTLAKEKQASFAEATRWYGDFLDSFHDDPTAPAANYQFADLLRENGDFGRAATQYERTAYEYPAHAKAAAAGYAAIFAHRENLKKVDASAQDAARRATVASSLRFADTFPQHEQAPVVLVAAAQDLYELKDHVAAREAGRKLLAKFPSASRELQRSAWTVVAHASFELADYPTAEQAYVQVLSTLPTDDASRADLVENLAASIYKQGEAANTAGDFRTAANHFLRIKQAAPTSKIRAGAQYDAGAALMRLQDWKAAAQVLDEFRRDNPGHELVQDATRQIASAFQQAGDLGGAAGEYERVANEATDPKLRAEALLLAGKLHEDSKNLERALAVYTRYVGEFPKPVVDALEARQRMADIHKTRGDDARYRAELQNVVQLDARAGSERTSRTRTLAGRAALVLTEPLYTRFAAIELKLPFEKSMAAKQKAMADAIKGFNTLVPYEVGDVTAAATFYMGEVYANFSRSLNESQRPGNLKGNALQDYNDQLDEMAFPFEEKAIGLHEKNLELLEAGVQSPWIEKSLARLAQLVPARYARPEASTGFLGQAERYEYVQPATTAPAATAPAATPAAPATTGDDDVSAH
ncbi:tetratricopeptide repeat protein [Lysobacter solisilvae (ex Woo and Kim 2020)]|uniref:Tetratricopeptide repeat protein n=1 Tax=Agrilutibacter terrestris TaxID=2865112 RepID=A0A7H0FU74_9GAMM|nr:tetratricopeptide repeat protein [Lysobacter terrestris]QNP39590.1 tetratricopeptide repeat protein [Lysobacter terrestris]